MTSIEEGGGQAATVPAAEPPLVGDVPMVGERRQMQLMVKRKTLSLTELAVMMAILMAAVIIGLGVGLGVGLRETGGTGSPEVEAPEETGSESPTPSPTVFIGVAATPAPTPGPSPRATLSQAVILRMNNIRSFLSTNGITPAETLGDDATPQSMAVRFLAEDTTAIPANIEGSYKFVERYALATLFYATALAPTGWDFRYNFIEKTRNVCRWNGRDLGDIETRGVECTNDVVDTIRIREYFVWLPTLVWKTSNRTPLSVPKQP